MGVPVRGSYYIWGIKKVYPYFGEVPILCMIFMFTVMLTCSRNIAERHVARRFRSAAFWFTRDSMPAPKWKAVKLEEVIERKAELNMEARPEGEAGEKKDEKNDEDGNPKP